MNLHLVFNKKSGHGEGEKIALLAEQLCAKYQATLIRHEVHDPKSISEISKKAVQASIKDNGIVAAAGGDGTIRSVAHHARGTKARVAAIPCGTFNLFARTHGIPETAEAALELALTGQASPIRLADINGETFILNASFGLYAKAIRERKRRTQRFGRHRIVAIGSTLMSMVEGHTMMNIDMLVDGKKRSVRTTMVFIGNNALQLRDLSLNVADCMKRDLLAAVTLKNMSGWKMVRLAFHGLHRTLEKLEELDSFCVEELEIKTNHKHLEVALDGEMFKLHSPLTIKALPGAMNLIKPG